MCWPLTDCSVYLQQQSNRWAPISEFPNHWADLDTCGAAVFASKFRHLGLVACCSLAPPPKGGVRVRGVGGREELDRSLRREIAMGQEAGRNESEIEADKQKQQSREYEASGDVHTGMGSGEEEGEGVGFEGIGNFGTRGSEEFGRVREGRREKEGEVVDDPGREEGEGDSRGGARIQEVGREGKDKHTVGIQGDGRSELSATGEDVFGSHSSDSEAQRRAHNVEREGMESVIGGLEEGIKGEDLKSRASSGFTDGTRSNIFAASVGERLGEGGRRQNGNVRGFYDARQSNGNEEEDLRREMQHLREARGEF